MTAVSEVLVKAKVDGCVAFIGYLLVGYLSVDVFIDVMCAMVVGGVDIVEIGILYSDLVMDGLTI